MKTRKKDVAAFISDLHSVGEADGFEWWRETYLEENGNPSKGCPVWLEQELSLITESDTVLTFEDKNGEKFTATISKPRLDKWSKWARSKAPLRESK